VTLTASPTLTVGGAVTPLGTVESLRLTWGRRGLLERPTPATVQLGLFDFATGAPLARRTDLIGQVIVVGWSGSDGSSGTLFRGRVTDATAEPSGLTAGGWRVALTAVSKELDAANYVQPEGTVWPAETFAQRRDRIMGFFPTGLFGGAGLPTRVDMGLSSNDTADATEPADYQAAAGDVGGQDALTLLRQLYDSLSPLVMVYDPATNWFGYTNRRRYLYNPATAQAPSARLVRAAVTGNAYTVAPVAGSPALTLPADALTYTGQLEQPAESRLSRVEVKWFNAGADSTAVAASGLDELTYGRRTLSVDSLHTTAATAAVCALQWSRLAVTEAAAPRLGALTYSTARTPFPDAATMAGLLVGRETGLQLFAAGAWAARLGVRPLFGVVGGVIGCAGTEWTVDLNPAPVSVEWPTTPLPIRYASSPAAALTLADLDPSVTFADLAFVDVGAGYTATTQPPWGTP
jgi:hypothetical protein